MTARSSRATVGLVVLALVAFLCCWQLASATHFAYGTVFWQKDTTVNSPNFGIILTWQLAWRSNWGWNPATPSTIGQVIQRNAANGGGYYPFSVVTNNGIGNGDYDIQQAVGSYDGTERWFYGVYSVRLGPYVINGQNPLTITHGDCCRLSTLEERNHDQNWRVRIVANINLGTRSPMATALPRIYLAVGVTNIFPLPSVAYDGYTNYYEMAPLDDSRLLNPRPCGQSSCGCTCKTNEDPDPAVTWDDGACANCEYVDPPNQYLNCDNTQYNPFFNENRQPGTAVGVPYQRCRCARCVSLTADGCGNCLAIASDGTVTWRPQNAGLYAMQVKIISKDGAAVKNSSPLDLILAVLPDCPTCPKVILKSAQTTYTAYVGLQLTYTVNGTSTNPSDTVSISNTPLPGFATITGCAESSGPTCTMTIRWTPQLGQGNQLVCFQGRGTPSGLVSLGQLCITMQVGAAGLIYLSGIIRDFNTSFIDFNRGNGELIGPTKRYVGDGLSIAGKPSLSSTLPPTSYTGGFAGVTGFDKWFNDDLAYNRGQVFSITLSNAESVVTPGGDRELYSFSSTSLYPIDCQLWQAGDNRCSRGITARNGQFTYEVHTYTKYNQGQVFKFRSSDDFWVFINGKRVELDLQGTHDSSVEAVLRMDDIATSHDLVPTFNYRQDMFFAHRHATRAPALQIQMPKSSLCNTLLYGQDVFPAYTSFAGMGSTLQLVGRATIDGTALRLISSSDGGPSAGIAYWAIGGNAQKVKVSNGFQTIFKFIGSTTTGCTGFTFIIQNSASNARGGDAQNLGYADIPKSIAIEFDGYQDTSLFDPVNPHISVHSMYDGINTAIETASAGGGSQLGISLYDPVLPLDFCNNTVQRVRIEYLPGQVDPESEEIAYGWIRVWMNDNLVPTAQAQIDSAKFDEKIGTVAYVGFTTGIYDTIKSTFQITEWSMIQVPTAPAKCTYDSPLTGPQAGSQGTVTVYARDSCSNRIRIGGESAQISATITPTKGNTVGFGLPVTVNVVDQGDGSYKLNYVPLVATSYTVYMTWTGVPIEGENPAPFTVNSGPTSRRSTLLVYSLPGLTALSLSNSPAGSRTGLFVVAINPTTMAVLLNTVFDFALPGSAAAFNRNITAFPANTIVALAFKNGASSANTAIASSSCNCGGESIQGSLSSLGSVMGGQATFGSVYDSCCVQARQWAMVGRKSAGAAKESFGTQKAFAVDCFRTVAGPAGEDFCVNVTSTASNAIEGQQASILVQPLEVRVPATSLTNPTISVLAIRAFDVYGNRKTQNTDSFAYSFSPPIESSSPGNEPGQLLNCPDGSDCAETCPTCTPGIYQIRFWGARANTYSLTVRLFDGSTLGEGITGSPFKVVIRAGPASALTTQTLGSGLNQATAGVTSNFQLNLLDAGGNQINAPQNDVITGGLYTSTGTLLAPVTPDPSWISGYLTVSFMTTVATVQNGYHVITVIINGMAMNLTNPRVIVAAGPIDVTKCTHTFATPIVAGASSTYTIESRDQYSNQRLTQSEPFTFTSVIPGGDVTGPTVAPQNLGVYQVTFRATVSGSRSVTSRYNSINIGGSVNPFSATILPGPVAVNSLLEGGTFNPASNIGTASVGSPYSLIVQALDQFGNVRTTDTDRDNLATKCVTGAGIVCTVSTITWTSLNRYTMAWGTTVAGTYTVGVTVAATGQDITSLPRTVTINPAASALSSSYSGAGLIGGVEGTSTSFTIQARDTFGNAQLSSVTDNFRFFSSVAPTPVACSKVPSTSTYNCAYTLPSLSQLGGGNQFTVTIQLQVGTFQNLINTPVTVTVAASTSSFPAVPIGLPVTVPAGVLTQFTVFDQTNGGVPQNPSCCVSVVVARTVATNMPADPDNSKFTFDAGPYVTIGAETPAGSGRYVVSLQLAPKTLGDDILGRYNVTIFRSGLRSTAGVWNITVVPGPFVVSKSLIPTSNTATAGVSTTFAIQLRDAYSYILTQTPPLNALNLTFAGTPAGGWLTGVWTPGYTQPYSHVFTFTRTLAGSVGGQIRDGRGPVVATVTINTNNAAAAASRCTASPNTNDPSGNNNGLTAANAGTGQNFFINSFDNFGNPTTETNIAFTATIVSTAIAVSCAWTVGNTYTCTYTPDTASPTPFSLEVRLGGVHIVGSPFALTLKPGPVSGANSGAFTMSAGPTNAGQPLTWVLQARDQFGNNWRSDDPGEIRAYVRTPLNSNPQATVTPVGANGRYTITMSDIDPTSGGGFPYTATVGAYTWTVTISGQAVTTGIVVQNVVAAAAYGPSTLMVDRPTFINGIEQQFSVRMQLADMYGNLISTAGVPVVPILQGGTPTCATAPNGEIVGAAQINGPVMVPPSVTYGVTSFSAGLYTVTFQAIVQGQFYLNATVNGQGLACNTARSNTVQISAGIANPNTTLLTSFPQPVVAGVPFTFDVLVKDRLGNARPAYGSDLVLLGGCGPDPRDGAA